LGKEDERPLCNQLTEVHVPLIPGNRVKATTLQSPKSAPSLDLFCFMSPDWQKVTLATNALIERHESESRVYLGYWSFPAQTFDQINAVNLETA
jgi:hypothetical protein